MPARTLSLVLDVNLPLRLLSSIMFTQKKLVENFQNNRNLHPSLRRGSTWASPAEFQGGGSSDDSGLLTNVLSLSFRRQKKFNSRQR